MKLARENEKTVRILLCPDKFKGSLSAVKVCYALRDGLLSADENLNIICHPMADGGDGSIELLKNYFNLHSIKIETLDPIGKPISAEYQYTNDTAFIEMASASGLVLLKEEERNPLLTSSYGTGLMIKHALDNGFKKINLFIGGSATNDGGIGIAKALGFIFLDGSDNELKPTGESLSNIRKIHSNNLYDFDNLEINILCDVENPMYGTNGTTHVYAAQKGADAKAIKELENGLINYATEIKCIIKKDISSFPGMGAAGAVGASLVGLMRAQLMDGFKMVAKNTGLNEEIKKADLVITGEGKVDKTSFQGKVVGNILSLCQSQSKPCYVVGGMIEDNKDISAKFAYSKSILSIAKNMSDALNNPEKHLCEIGNDLGNKIINLKEDKVEIFNNINEKLKSEGYTFERTDFNRPWGGFFVLNELHKQQFIDEYFNSELSNKVNVDMKLSPKILVVSPNKRLSWQYHHRRSELWQVVEGNVGVVKSDTDEETEMKIYKPGDRIELSNGERHRLIGLDHFGIVAEIWVHEDPSNPSDENDIIRLQDDYGR